jgi:hypothetical protein
MLLSEIPSYKFLTLLHIFNNFGQVPSMIQWTVQELEEIISNITDVPDGVGFA